MFSLSNPSSKGEIAMTFLAVLEGSLKSAMESSISLKRPLGRGLSFGYFILEEVGEVPMIVFIFETAKGVGEGA